MASLTLVARSPAGSGCRAPSLGRAHALVAIAIAALTCREYRVRWRTQRPPVGRLAAWLRPRAPRRSEAHRAGSRATSWRQRGMPIAAHRPPATAAPVRRRRARADARPTRKDTVPHFVVPVQAPLRVTWRAVPVVVRRGVIPVAQDRPVARAHTARRGAAAAAPDAAAVAMAVADRARREAAAATAVRVAPRAAGCREEAGAAAVAPADSAVAVAVAALEAGAVVEGVDDARATHEGGPTGPPSCLPGRFEPCHRSIP